MRHSLALFLLLTLSACNIFTPLPGSQSAENAKFVSAEELYAEAKDYMNDGSYTKAIESLERLQARYPYGRFGQQAQLEIAYAYYKQREPDPALSTIDRFIKQFPNSPRLDYAYYLKGLINFNEDLGLFGDFSGQDPSERDPRMARASYDTFQELITRFPNSRYAADAKIRMQYLINALARSEMHIAGYYLRRGAYVAALNRAKNVVTQYPQSPQTRDALLVMIKAYDALGMTDLRNDTQRVLDLNVAKDGIQPGAYKSAADEAAWWQFWK
ncbi:MAG: outer membrane protein assembly factor BamD [Pseudomonadota bacterium]